MRQNFDIIFFDLDGTLLTGKFELTEGTIKAVNDIRNAGFRISIATGRSYISASPFLDLLDIVEPIVFSNGAVVDNPETGERELVAGIPLETALIILMLIPEFQISYKVHLADGTVFKSDETPWPDEGQHFSIGNIVSNLKANLEEDPAKFVFHDPLNQMDQFIDRLEAVLGKKSTIRWFKSHDRYIEMTNKSVSKGKAIQDLVKKLEIPTERVIAVGDQDNDLEMVRDLGFGVVAGKGTDALNSVCDYRIPAPEENGIELLRDYLLQSVHF